MNTFLEIESTGPTMTIQDSGRPGYARFGLSAGGAMDPWAMREGEILLGNPSGSAALEMASYGGRFQVRNGVCWCALTGAAMTANLGGTPVPWRSSFCLHPGQWLNVGPVLSHTEGSGTYGYLHVAGGFDTPMEIGARGTHLRAGVGGLDGQPLPSRTCLSIRTLTKSDPIPHNLPVPGYLSQRTIRVVWGPHSGRFSPQSRERLLSEAFAVSLRRDRMAMRLDPAAANPFESLLTGLSDPVMLGDIQVPGDGFPAILMREHQPTGGYPRIATVISADIVAAAQLPTGEPFRFALVNTDQAVKALEVWQAQMQSLASRMRRRTRTPEQIDDLLAYNLISGTVSADAP